MANSIPSPPPCPAFALPWPVCSRFEHGTSPTGTPLGHWTQPTGTPRLGETLTSSWATSRCSPLRALGRSSAHLSFSTGQRLHTRHRAYQPRVARPAGPPTRWGNRHTPVNRYPQGMGDRTPIRRRDHEATGLFRPLRTRSIRCIAVVRSRREALPARRRAAASSPGRPTRPSARARDRRHRGERCL